MSTVLEKVKDLFLNFTKIFETLIEKYLQLPELTKIFVNIIIIYVVALGATQVIKKLIIGLPKMLAFIIFIVCVLYFAYSYLMR